MDPYNRKSHAEYIINANNNEGYGTQNNELLKEIAINSGIIADALKQLINITYTERHVK